MEFCDLGAFCSFKECQQQDFLPFKCNICLKDYCLDHRTASSHGCDDKGVKALICQICSKGIRIQEESNQEKLMQEHLQNDCSAQQNQKCQFCKKKLTIVTSINCTVCNKKVCIKDRHLHKCQAQTSTLKTNIKKDQNKEFKILQARCPSCGVEVINEEEMNLHLIYQH